jgi:mannose-1-phosphate guanylyltransferase/mannose-6-phosphate isomerase
MTRQIHPVILSGGSGSRLWPASRALYPKQLLPLTGPATMLGETLGRVAERTGYAPPTLICNAEHRFLVAEEMRKHTGGGRIVLEPEGRNTAAAAAVGALLVAERDPDGLMLLLPSDHVVADDGAFDAAVAHAAAAADRGYLATFGVTPTRAETGYGYIRRGAPLADAPGVHAVAGFVEKPDAARAEAFLADGGYLWNSGMFLVPAQTLLAELDHRAPTILAACRDALSGARRDLDFERLDADAFARAPARSLDYAVMEHTTRAAVVPVAMGWSDIGSWNGLWQMLAKDAHGNARQGDVHARDSRNCLLRSDEQLLVTLGVSDLVVVSTDDAVLVCPRERAQEVGPVVAELRQEGRSQPEVHTTVYRPWGSYRGIDLGERFQVKRITVSPGAKLSLQRHRHRAEHWVVVDGVAEVTRDDEVFTLRANESAHIPLGAVHRLANPGDAPLHIIEVQCGTYLGEDDIERFADTYGR